MDLDSLKALAARIAGDVMNQIEKDGAVVRGNLEEQIAAALFLDGYAMKGLPEKGKFSTSVSLDGSIHVICRCPDCERRRKVFRAASATPSLSS